MLAEAIAPMAFTGTYWKAGGAFHNLPFPEKKKLINLIFAGKDEQGRKYGIFVSHIEGKQRNKEFKFEAYGRLGTLKGWTGNEPLYNDMNAENMAGQIVESMGKSIITKKP